MNATGTEQWNWDDGSGQRVMQRTSVGGTVSSTVCAFGLEEHQYNASGTNTGNTSSYSVGGHLIGEQTGTSTKTTTFLLTDLLGSVVASFSNTAGSAAVQGNRAYSPYGAPLYQQGSVGTSRGFTGQYADSTSGLDYDNARYYDPLVGQFVSADSVQGNLVGMDPYAYVGGNPETWTDPTGHACLEDCGGVPPDDYYAGGGSVTEPGGGSASGASLTNTGITVIDTPEGQYTFDGTNLYDPSGQLVSTMSEEYVQVMQQLANQEAAANPPEIPPSNLPETPPSSPQPTNSTTSDGNTSPTTDTTTTETNYAKAAGDAAKSFRAGLGRLRQIITVAVAYYNDVMGNIYMFVSVNSSALYNPSLSGYIAAIAQQAEEMGATFIDEGIPGVHAEINNIAATEGQGLQLRGIGASNRICYECYKQILEEGGTDVIGTNVREPEPYKIAVNGRKLYRNLYIPPWWGK